MTRHMILGAGSGIGAALARRLAGPGVVLGLHTGRRVDALAGVAADCRARGAQVECLTGDLAEAATFATIEALLPDLAPLTGLVFAAGYARLGPLADTGAGVLGDAFAAMPLAFHRAVRLALPCLAEGSGRVVALSAFGPHRPRLAAFAATAPAKAALEAQIRALAMELAPRGITCNAVAPGLIAKPPGTPSALSAQEWEAMRRSIPLGRLGQPEEVAALLAFLLSAEAGYMTGQILHLDGGLML